MSPETFDEWAGIFLIALGIGMIAVGMWRDLKRGRS